MSLQSLASRMQLVALHMATTSILPDNLLGMTGEERAIVLMRQCFINRPLNEQEHSNLNTIKQLARYLFSSFYLCYSCHYARHLLTTIHACFYRGRSPTLSLVCQDFSKMSHQLSFLCPNRSGCVKEHLCFEGSAYLNNVESGKLGIRCYLTKQEESRVLGTHARKPKLPPRFIPNQALCPFHAANNELEALQEELDQCHSRTTNNAINEVTNAPFPLDITPSSKLEADMMDELKESWKAHKGSSSSSVKQTRANIEDLCTDFSRLKTQASNLLLKVEDYLLNALNKKPLDCSHWHDNAHEMLRNVGIVPSATIADLAKISFMPSLIEDFNPMLNQKAREVVVKSIIIWLQLCVYEDKLTRLISLCGVGTYEDVVKELETKTIWVPAEHPYWLVFEVENAIMIRQEQYKVAKHLIDNPGHVLQLNMGLGKVSSFSSMHYDSTAS